VPGGGPMAWDRYAYVSDNPLRYTDPTGRYTFEEEPDDPHRRPKPPFTDDGSWGDPNKKNMRWQEVRRYLSRYDGPKWWTGRVPSNQELATFLFVEEGGLTLKDKEDRRMMAWILLYSIGRSGPAEFTPMTNPVTHPDFEKANFTANDLNAMLHPSPLDLKSAETYVNAAIDGGLSEQLPPYLYWVSKEEIRAALHTEDVHWRGGHHAAPTVDNSYLVFLQMHEDFSMAR